MYTGGPDPESGDGMDLVSSSSALDLPSMAVSNKAPELRFKIALSLYKVQQNIYLLDFQRIEGDILGFMKLCTLVISELKNLSAAQRQAQLAQQAAGVPPQGR
jgi:5'-AMP-activated protein kinase catalytic alpha subunit